MTSPPVSSPENPLPVRSVATKVAGWIDRLGSIWVEGQLTQVSVRQGTRTAFKHRAIEPAPRTRLADIADNYAGATQGDCR